MPMKKIIFIVFFLTGAITLVFNYYSNKQRHDDDHYHEKISSLDYISLAEHAKRLEESKQNLLEQFRRNQTQSQESQKQEVPTAGLTNVIYPQLNMKQFYESKDPPNFNVPSNIINSLQNLERLVHIDLKGAPPKIDYFNDFLPLIKRHGATGIIIEYEDMFPYEGILKDVRHGNAYTPDDVKKLLDLASQSGLTVMPLIQTYGHLEWLLKHEKFAHLREHSSYPQVITPCIEESYSVIFEMLDQVIQLHPNVPYFHIGCDEVYYKLLNKMCANPTLKFGGDFSKAFMNHTIRVAAHIRQKLPKSKIIIWHDMLGHTDLKPYKDAIDANEIEPMLWAYMENVESWFQEADYVRFGQVFKNIWAASAFKGASGELVTITSIEHHYLNQISWNRIFHAKKQSKVCNFVGVAITGWSRYDHFLAPCDLLPQAVPSLIYCLTAATIGEVNQTEAKKIEQDLGCNRPIAMNPKNMFDTSVICTFPGHEVYEAIIPIDSLIQTLASNIEFANKYITAVSINQNYAHVARAEESLHKLENSYAQLVYFQNKFIKACEKYYMSDTVAEWLDVYITPHLNNLYEYLKATKRVMKERKWKPRPLPITPKQFPERVDK